MELLLLLATLAADGGLHPVVPPFTGDACTVTLCGDPLYGEQACYVATGHEREGGWDREVDCEAYAACREKRSVKACEAKVKSERSREGRQ